MPSNAPLDALPLWGFFIAILLLILLSVESGYRLGKLRRNQSEEKEAPVGAMVGATLGLLAFLLAFTFGLAASHFDVRRQLVLDEANAIGTSYLRAELLPDRGAEVRALFRSYVDVRLEAVRSGMVVEGMRRSEDLQNQLWAQAVPIAVQHPGSMVVGLFVQSLNEVIDLHAKRVAAGVRVRIQNVIWAALIGVAGLSFVVMGYHAGLAATPRSPAILAVAITFSVVIGLIADLDRPQEGTLKVSQQALMDLRQSMNEAK